MAAAAAAQGTGCSVDPEAIELAHKLADAAARVTTRYFRCGARHQGRVWADTAHVLAPGAPASPPPPSVGALPVPPTPLATSLRASFEVDTKSDASPVTAADREAEDAMRALIHASMPGHAVFGEERGLTRGAGGGDEWLWVLDPIDGTKSFITGARAGVGVRVGGRGKGAGPRRSLV